GLATLAPRDRTHIMHDKFIVTDAPSNPAPARVLTGSANFTTEGLTEQANVLHAFDSPALAALYNERAHAPTSPPTVARSPRSTDSRPARGRAR
ncbi:phospholipase D-like domain-containing protein, partial [Burkholderia cenocepacia]|nr:phospholipase D-like domain-containing protein [Burkholderia cenocepacia]